MQDSKKYYDNKIFVYSIQILTILFITMTTIELTLKAMLVFGYFMLFRQERWHKHLLIMFIMISILFVSSEIMIKSTNLIAM
ncbi:MAG: hypothetical protein DRG78_18905 [Epsilonproteobacteria bacterium]|nr:MAG: hypothetical protein DRG78_18905 [Campylobacterota bacterium]